MYVKCVAVVAALAMVAVGTTSALTEEERTAEIAKLMDQLSTLKQADARERRASVTTPGITTNKGDLTFQVVEGKRIGYSIGNNKTMFDELAKTDTVMAEQVQAAFKTGQLSASVQCNAVSNLESAFTGKLDGAVKPLQEKLNSLEKKIETTDKKLESTEGKITEAKAAADPVYWLDNRVDTDEAEERGKTFVAPGQSTTLKITGVGFEPRFHPLSGGQLACGFAPKDSKMKKATSHGDIRAEAIAGKVYYHVECLTPSYPLGAVVTVTLAEHDGKAIPFIGCPTCNKYEVLATHEATKTTRENFPHKPTYQAHGRFNVGASYKCKFQGSSGKYERTVKATTVKFIDCGLAPTTQISGLNRGIGEATLTIYSGSEEIKPKSSSISKIQYYVCDTVVNGECDCTTGCRPQYYNRRAGQQQWTSPGTYTWTPNFCGTVSVVAIGAGSAGGTQWSSGGGGGGGLGWARRLGVKQGVGYKIVVGRGGKCGSNAGRNSEKAYMGGGTSFFRDNKTVAGFGGSQGGPHSESDNAGYGGGYVGDGGGRGGRGGRGSWTGGGGGAGGYKGRGGDANGCHNGNRGCDAPSGSGGGGGGGYYSSTYGTPGGGGVGLNGHGGSGRGDWQRGSTGGSSGSSGAHGEPYSNGRGSCRIYGGRNGGGGGGSGSNGNAGGGDGGHGAVRIIWGNGPNPGREYPAGGGNV